MTGHTCRLPGTCHSSGCSSVLVTAVAPGDTSGVVLQIPTSLHFSVGLCPSESPSAGRPVWCMAGAWVGRPGQGTVLRSGAPPALMVLLSCARPVASTWTRRQARRGHVVLGQVVCVSSRLGLHSAANAELCPRGVSDGSRGLLPPWGKTFVFRKAGARTRAAVPFVMAESGRLSTCVRRGRADCGLVLNHRKLLFL